MTKVKKLQEKMKAAGIDALLVTSEINEEYVSGFPFTDGHILVFPEKAYLLTDFRYIEAVRAAVDPADFEILMPDRSQLIVMHELLTAHGVSTVAVEEGEISLSLVERLRELWQPIAVTGGATALLLDLRAVKDEDELAAIAEAQRITDDAFSHILHVLNENMTEIDVALELEFFMRKHGATRTSFDTIAVSGDASSMPHGVPRPEKLHRGFLTMDFGCVFHGYCSDMTRTVVLGQADADMKRLYDTVLRAQTEALAAAAAGERGCFALDKIARDVIENAGYRGAFGHSLGHGVGRYIHEAPRLAPRVDKEARLVPGNVVTFEPGIYLAGQYGCRIEDLAAVTEDGILDFTKSKKDLIELF